MLTKEQAEAVKKQIIHHIEESFPEDKKSFARKRIESMASEELEEFLKKNNLSMNQTSQEANGKSPQCVFCSIISGDISSHKIDENEFAIAVLEINPISKGHILVIPKEHSASHKKEQKKIIEKLVKDISKLLEQKLKPKKVIISHSNLFGHGTTSVIPQFNNETAESERHSATPEEISELQKLLSTRKENPTKKVEKIRVKKSKPERIEEKTWLPRRIP